MADISTSPALSRLDFSVFRDRESQIRRAVFDSRLRSELCADAGLLSAILRELIQLEADSAATVPEHIAAPKVIMQYWHDKNNVPDDVVRCMETWLQLDQNGFTFEYFDDDAALEFLRKHWTERECRAFISCHHPAMRCDYFRLAYLYRKGGIYIDADEAKSGDLPLTLSTYPLSLQPLCYETSQSGRMVPAEEWLRNPSASDFWFFYLNNNPIAAKANHPLLAIALARATDAIFSSIENNQKPDISATTGPSNMSISFFDYLLLQLDGQVGAGFALNTRWETIAHSEWDLSYRKDSRNWRSGENFYSRGV